MNGRLSARAPRYRAAAAFAGVDSHNISTIAISAAAANAESVLMASSIYISLAVYECLNAYIKAPSALVSISRRMRHGGAITRFRDISE